MYKNLIFDFDGTIADSKACSVIATKQSFVEYGLEEPSDSEVEYYMGIPIEESFKHMSNSKLNEEELTQLIALFRKNYKRTEENHLKIYAGMFEQLNSLSNKVKLFVVSSKKTNVLKRNLEILKIDDLFIEVIGSDKVDHYKPEPDGIYHILNQHHLKKEETLYIGDAIFDIKMAKNAGVDACAVTWGSHSKEDLKVENPKIMIDHIQELETLGE